MFCLLFLPFDTSRLRDFHGFGGLLCLLTSRAPSFDDNVKRGFDSFVPWLRFDACMVVPLLMVMLVMDCCILDTDIDCLLLTLSLSFCFRLGVSIPQFILVMFLWPFRLFLPLLLANVFWNSLSVTSTEDGFNIGSGVYESASFFCCFEWKDTGFAIVPIGSSKSRLLHKSFVSPNKAPCQYQYSIVLRLLELI